MRILALLLLLLASPAAAQVCAPRALPQVNSCSADTRVSLAIVGDVLLHRALQWRGYARGFDTIWGAATPLLQPADLTIANLEGPTAAGFTQNGRRVADPGPVLDDEVYTGYPRFNYHPVVLDELRAAGVDIVTTANNHALDRGPAGLDATLAAIDRAGLTQVGAVTGGASRFAARRIRTAAGPLSLIACTFGTNGIADPRGQVLRCYDDRAQLLRLVTEEAESGAGVLVLLHWGPEYVLTPDAQQRRLARELVVAGAMAVVGTHPHVPQPWEMLTGANGTVPVIYSTGNFVAAQPPLERATSLLAWLEVCPGPRAPRVAGAGFVPLQMEFEGADPSLTLPRPGLSPRAEAGHALLARLIPGHDLTVMVDCRGSGSGGAGSRGSGPSQRFIFDR
ncbi:CapA family protein [Pararhodobacter oceanensis]|uniref:CapA family protein n=1 Tax=Pararhodobacter oceanensis TaxID=2172121 RepID=UPI003A8E5148